MPPEKFNASDFLITLNGKPIGNMQSADLTLKPKEKEIKNRENLTLFNRDMSCTIKNVEVEPDFIGKLLPVNKTYTVIGKGYRLPRGNGLPKKKRIRKKWMKKYVHDFRLDNCIMC